VTFSAVTLDDLLDDLYSTACRWCDCECDAGDTLELAGVVLELTKPLARLSRSQAHRIIFSCLGELCWYLAGDDWLKTIRYYLPAYDEDAVDGRVRATPIRACTLAT
jgi:thymidylate synthase